MHPHGRGLLPWAETKGFPGRDELHFLWHPETEDVFSGDGLVTGKGFKDYLVGILMVDRPRPADPEWLEEAKPPCMSKGLLDRTLAIAPGPWEGHPAHLLRQAPR
jgi:hypothetical protein